MLKYSLIAVCIGVVLDFILGDPHTPYHPVCLIGNLISSLEKHFRKTFPKSQQGELVGGFGLAICVILIATLIPACLIGIAYRIHPYLGIAVEAFLAYTMMATKSLKDESKKVKIALEKDGLEEGRKAVSMIVGRDTNVLDEKGVIKATVETIAENFSDGVIAPLFYMILFGAVGGYMYKAVNTMDSMLGYKNEKYLYFGRAAAKLDDVFNFIPARISAFLLLLASLFLKLDTRHGYQMFKRDRYNHASPNSAQTEAVAAGVLNVQLAGPAWYFGTYYDKKTIGDDIRPIELEDITRMHKLMYLATILGVLIFGLCKFIFI